MLKNEKNETLRERAERRLAVGGRPEISKMSTEEVAVAIHELQTHQIELEMQNEELRQAQASLVEARDQYAALYDFAPTGYLTLDEKGLIVKSNLTLADMLGVPRDQLIRHPLSAFVVAEDQDIYFLYKRKIIDTKEIQICELRLNALNGDSFWVEIDCVFDEADKQIRATVSDITKRKHADEKLRMNQEKLRLTIDHSPLGVCTVDSNGHFTEVNPAYEKIMGYSHEELRNLSFLDITYPEDRSSNQSRFQNMVSGKKPGFSIEKRYIRKDGAVIFVAIHAEAIRDDAGNPLFGFAIVEDITLRKQAEAEKERLARFPSENPSPVMRVTAQGILEYANEASTQFLSTMGAEVGGQVNPEWQARIDEVVAAARPTGVELPAEDRIFAVTLAPVMDQGYVNLYACDITARIQVEGARELLAAAIDQANEAVLITDLEGTIQYTNPAFEQFTGYSSEEVLGKNPNILKSGKQDDTFYQTMWKTLAGGSIWRGQFVNKKKDDTLYTEEATISPVRNAAGRIMNYVAVKRDISEAIQLEDQLRQSQKMEAIGHLVGGIAHDFNNILQIINGYAESALATMSLHENVRAKVFEIAAAGARAAVLVRQLLTFSRQQVINPEDLDLNEVIADGLKMLRRTLAENIEFEFIPARELDNVCMDRGQVGQVLMNLCVNARDAMPEGGRLTIQTGNVSLAEEDVKIQLCGMPGRYVLLCVTDTGLGMSKETLDHIFEPFFTTKEVGKGTGLGLSTVFGILKQNGGHVAVESEVGKGTVFKIYFPVLCPVLKERVQKAESIAIGGTETILVAEDDMAVLTLTEHTLRAAGYTVLVAKDGEEALQLFRKNAEVIDLVVFDIVMPRMGGKVAVNAILKLRPKLPYLFVSGYSGSAVHTGFLKEKKSPVLTKPYRSNELLKKIRQVIDKKPF